LKLVELLISNKADINATTNVGYTALHWVSYKGHLDICRYLIAEGCDVTIKSDFGTALDQAAKGGHQDIVDLLLPKIFKSPESGKTIRFQVKALYDFDAQPGTVELSINAGDILTVTRTDIGDGWWEGSNTRGKSGLFPIAYVEVNTRPMVQKVEDKIYLLKGAMSLEGQFMYSCQYGELEEIKTILEEFKTKRIDINVQDVNQKTSLYLAVENNQESVVKYLLENNVNANLSNYHNSTPLHTSSEHGYVRITELLLSNGAKTNLRDRDGDTPLLCCAFGGNVEIAKMLLQKDPYAILSINLKKNSVLHYSAEKGHMNMTRFLLSQGASKLLINSDDKTPEQVAMDNNFEEIAKVIADYSSNLLRPTQDKWFKRLKKFLFRKK